ncbi:host-nuclease inhibitor Gam family protein [Biomaibacter acetigenes]|nr:host-nuclease inhibitor Gam family protein [Biomaibacter acetigenes]
MMNILANIALKNLGVDIEDEQQKESWKIENDSQADWALDKIREAKAEFRRFEMVVNDKIAQLQEALAAEKEKMEREVGFFSGKLAEYFETVPHKKTKTQETYALPSGKLIKKYKQPKIERDEEKLIAWLEQNGMTELVKIEKRADWATLKKDTVIDGERVISKTTGEAIPGVVAIPQNPEFTVEV